MTETEIRAARERIEAYDRAFAVRESRLKTVRDRYDAEFEALRREYDQKHRAIEDRRDAARGIVELSHLLTERVIDDAYDYDRRQPAGLLTA